MEKSHGGDFEYRKFLGSHAEENMVEKSIKVVTREEMVIALKAMKSGKVTKSCKVCAEMIFACGEAEIALIMKLCRVFGGNEMWD